jgi:hypothetical protein
MNWDKLFYQAVRHIVASPLLAFLVADILIHTPIRHCQENAPQVCNAINLNLFIIQFPYMNLVRTFDDSALIALLVYIGFRMYFYFSSNKENAPQDQNNETKNTD